jgi:hypothetical protein
MTVIELTSDQDKAAHRAVVEYMLLDRDMGLNSDEADMAYATRRMAELTQEIETVFGPDALEYSASFFTGGKFSSDEIVVFAATEWNQLKSIMHGEEL